MRYTGKTASFLNQVPGCEPVYLQINVSPGHKIMIDMTQSLPYHPCQLFINLVMIMITILSDIQSNFSD